MLPHNHNRPDDRVVWAVLFSSVNAKQPERPALQAGPSRCESDHGRQAPKVQSDCTPVCETGGSRCKSTWERQFSWWPWCNSSIMPCDGIGAGANPVGHPNFSAVEHVHSQFDSYPSAPFGWAEVRGLSLVIGSSPIAGSRCRRSSMVEQPPQGVIPRQSLAHL